MFMLRTRGLRLPAYQHYRYGCDAQPHTKLAHQTFSTEKNTKIPEKDLS